MNITDKVVELVLQNARNKNAILSDVRKTRLVEELGYDSISLINLFMQMEEQFEFEIEDVDLINAMTIGNLVDICIRNMSE